MLLPSRYLRRQLLSFLLGTHVCLAQCTHKKLHPIWLGLILLINQNYQLFSRNFDNTFFAIKANYKTNVRYLRKSHWCKQFFQSRHQKEGLFPDLEVCRPNLDPVLRHLIQLSLKRSLNGGKFTFCLIKQQMLQNLCHLIGH